jgi:hypothetical protein
MSTAITSSATGKKFLGFPLEGFGFFTSMLLTFAAGFLAFFAATTLAIFGFLIWNLISGVKPDYAKTYLYVGLPAGLIVLVIAVIVFGTLWLRATFSNK